jgi:hypothetical protein
MSKSFLLTITLFATGSSMFAENLRGFRFSGPEITKLEWNAKCLVTGDINGDGRADLAVINANRSRIEIFYRRKPGEKVARVRSIRPDRWEPDLEDAPYLREGVTYEGASTALAIGDLDGDGNIDLLYGGKDEGVHVRFRDKKGSWSEPLEVDTFDPLPGTQSITVQDFNGDGEAELIVFSGKGMERIAFKGRKQLGRSRPRILSSDDASDFLFADIDGDGDEDLLYLSNTSERDLRTLCWGGSGFLSETSHPFNLDKLSMARIGSKPGDGPIFGSVDSKSGEAMTFHFTMKESKGQWKPQIHNLFTEKDGSTQHVLADFDGDGLADIVATAAGVPELRFLRGRNGGGFGSAEVFPFLRGVSALAAGDFTGDGKLALLVASDQEDVFGISHLLEGKGFSFPIPLPIEDEIVALACADFDGDGKDEAIAVSKKKYDYRLHRLKPSEDAVEVVGDPMDLDDLERDPSGILHRDLDGDDDLDLIILSDRGPAIIFMRDKEGGFEEVEKKSSIRQSLLKSIDAARTGWGDLDGDGREDLLIGGKGFVRAVGFGKGGLKVLDQFNARSGNEQLSCPRLVDLDNDGNFEAIAYDMAQGAFQIFEREKVGGFRYARSIEVGSHSLQDLELVKFGKGTHLHLLAFGSRDLWDIPLSGKSLVGTVATRYETDLKDVRYSQSLFGDFDGDGDNDLLTIDATHHLIEFLRFTKGRDVVWESVLHFRVFEENGHYRGRKGGQNEPREGHVLDLNGDGKDDFVLLVHDRLLTYLQE